MPREKQINRVQSKRAASKEAMKQMHLLLGDENKYEISSDDDDVIEVNVEPPKKKYKLSNRKSSDGNDRDVIVLKTVDENFFDLEVEIEELAPCQKSRNDLLQKEKKEVEVKIEQLMAVPNTEVIHKGVLTSAIEISEQLKVIIGAATATASTTQYTITNQPPTIAPSGPVQQPPVASPSLVLQQQPTTGNNALHQSYQLVMDPRSGVIVGAVPTPSNAPNNPPQLQLYQSKSLATTTTVDSPTMKTRRNAVLRQVPSNAMPPLTKVPLGPPKTPVAANKGQPKIQVKQMLGKTVSPKTGVAAKTIAPAKPLPTPSKPMPPPQKTPIPIKTRTQAPNFRPTESNVEGGLSMGTKPTKSIDLTGDDGRALPDSREVSFNKLQGRTYPSLVVVARPHLRVKDLAADRSKLDVKVKSVLMYPPTKFTEWLIQQGLVRSDQKCTMHASNPLKLGMYSDASKFPYSGGYVWISECCPQRFVSVFSGSIFEGSQHPPMAILKLLYHWCCQTIVQNVTQWVKVDNLYVKGMYTWLRSVCTVAIHTHIKQLGGPGVKVQVGVISLGTTSQDGNKREVKVEVLGILETTTRHIRLRAVEPLSDGERNYKKRFTKILEPVFNWVHPQSIIVTDLTVDKATLHQMGFLHVSQNTSNDYANSNRTIMEYLRRIVPRMFQNTLSLLSRQIIQQFLDELVWREWYGTTVLQCFDNMISHLSEQTRYDSFQSLIFRLNKVSSHPFKNWAIPVPGSTSTTPAPAPPPAPTVTKPIEAAPKRYNRQRKVVVPPLPPPSPPQEIVRPSKSTSPDVPEQMVPLENYYYGTITPPPGQKSKVTIHIRCPFCKLTFNTNIALMNHLFKHAHNVSNDVQLCKYCLTIVPTASDLLKHINMAHPEETKFDNAFVCLICEAQFRNPFILGKHMSKEHCPSELPYMCGTCTFRCSNHKQAVDHFYQHHDHGTTIQCPFCLKSTTIFSGGRNISQNMNYFIQHLQKHQKKQLAKRCGKCTLWFIQKEFLKDHQIKMHVSQRGKPGLMPAFAPRNGIMVPKSKMDKYPDDAKIINFSTLYFNVNKNLNCRECNQPLNTPKHFTSFESCQNPNCQFSTCCSSAMQNHVAKCKFLNSKLPAGKLLPYEMFCICGYSDIHGNLMAKHLAICERKTAYPSKEGAFQATVTHSMLDVLGLVRKPEEATSSNNPPSTPLKGAPIILKPRGRPRKMQLLVKNVPDVNTGAELSICDVRGGVKDDEDKEKNKSLDEVDLTEDESENDEMNVTVIERKVEKDEMNVTVIERKVEKDVEITEVTQVEKKDEDEQGEKEKESKGSSVEKEEEDKEDRVQEEAEVQKGLVEKEREEAKEGQVEKKGEDKQEEVKEGHVEKEGEDNQEEAKEDHVENEGEAKESRVEKEGEEKQEEINKGQVEKEREDTEEELKDDESHVEKDGGEEVGKRDQVNLEEVTVEKEIIETEEEESQVEMKDKEEQEEEIVEDKEEQVEESVEDTEEQEKESRVEEERQGEQIIEELEQFVNEEQQSEEKEDSEEKNTEEVENNEVVSESNANTIDTSSELVESESMEVDSCNNENETIDKLEEIVAIESKMDENSEITKDICPMDTD